MSGMGKNNKSSGKCPHCGKSIKAHKGNNYNFSELSKNQMDSSIIVSVVNLRKSIQCRSKRYGSFDHTRIKAVKILLK
jgi:hypothetical protein